SSTCNSGTRFASRKTRCAALKPDQKARRSSPSAHRTRAPATLTWNRTGGATDTVLLVLLSNTRARARTPTPEGGVQSRHPRGRRYLPSAHVSVPISFRFPRCVGRL